MKLILHFQKLDKYENPVFIAKQEDIPESFDKLTKIYRRLTEVDYGTYLPIFSHSEFKYTTIRFFKNSKFNKFKVHATYEITFSINKKTKNEKTYVNCYISKVKFVKGAEKVDLGEVMDFSDDDE